MPEELDREAVRTAFVKEVLDHVLGEMLPKVELDRVVDGHGHTGGVDGDAEVAADTVHELGREFEISAVVLLNSLVKGEDLGFDHCGSQSAHAETVVGKLLGEITEGLRPRNGGVLRCEALVGSGVNGAASSNVVVVREEEAALARVDHLVTLTADAADLAHVASVLALPLYTKRVGAVLEESRTVTFAGLKDCVHVTNLSAHVRNEDMVAIRMGSELLLKIVNVHDVIVIGLNVDRLWGKHAEVSTGSTV